MTTQLQNFYESTCTRNWTATTGDFNVSVAPSISSGYIVISPSDRVRREIVKFSATGTNGYGPFVTISNISDRGLGGTTAQTHTIGEKVRMNITAQHWDELIASAVAPTVDVGTTTTLDPGSDATATNSGTDVAAVIDFAIPAGSTIYSGTSIPDNSVGRNGDWAFDTSVNCYVWYKSGGSWALVNSLKGATGDGNGIASIVKTGTVGLVDTYTITYDDATTTTFDVTNGAKGDQGDAGISVVSIIKTDTVGLVDTYTITYSNSTTSTFDVTNGQDGTNGLDGTDGIDGISFLWQGAYDNGTAYKVNDAVSYNGSSYMCKLDSTGNLPTNTTYWDVMAQKGTDGTGTGDVLGPATNTANYIPQWDGADSKTLKDGLGLDTDLSSVSANDDTVPSAKATKAMGDLKLAIASKATQAEVATGTDNDKYVTPLAVQPYSNNSIYRQAIINGNFDVWQRGTSFTNPASGTYTADRTRTVVLLDGGIDPTNVIHSRQLQNAGDLFGSNYFYRVNTDGAGSGYGANSGHVIQHNIENGTAKLCGASKTVTLSFYARSSIAGKKLGYYVVQNYGTGGSPTVEEPIIGDKITLTSTWTKYTHTFTTNTLSGKTFGTNGDDWFKINFVTQWGATLFGNLVNSSGVAETFVGSGNIDIAQVQLNAGSVALPFQPKSYAEELRDCQRYYVNFLEPNFRTPVSVSTTTAITQIFLPLPVPMRIAPTTTLKGSRNTDWVLQTADNNTSSTGTFDGTGLNKNFALLKFTSGTYTAKEMLNVVIASSSGGIEVSAEL